MLVLKSAVLIAATSTAELMSKRAGRPKRALRQNRRLRRAGTKQRCARERCANQQRERERQHLERELFEVA